MGGIDGLGKFIILRRMFEAFKERGDLIECVVVVFGYFVLFVIVEDICKKLNVIILCFDGIVVVDLCIFIVKNFNFG